MTCPLCEPQAQEIWRDHLFSILDVGDDNFPLYLRIVTCRHITHMKEFSSEEMTRLTELLLKIEQKMLDIAHCDKVNVAQFGNVVDHMHWHIIGRWKNDPYFPDSPWGMQQRRIDQHDLLLRKGKKEELIKALLSYLNS